MSLQFKSSLVPLYCLGLFLAGILMLGGCESSPEATTYEAASDEINLSIPTANPSSLLMGETSVIEVIATDGNGEPIAGLSISFISNSGYFTPSVVESNSEGIATTIYTPTSDGSHSLRTWATGAESQYVSVNVSSNQESSGNVRISVNPTLLTADGSSTATVIVHVDDAAGNPAADSTMVKIVAGEKFEDQDGDGYFTDGVDYLIYDINGNFDWDPIGVIPAIAYTEAGSIAVTFSAGTEAATSYIKATVNDDILYNGFAEIPILLTPDAQVFAIELTADEPGIHVKGTGGIETTNLHATCYDVNGNTVPEGITVNFVITSAPDNPAVPDSVNIAGQGYGPVAALTNSDGMATVPIWSGTISGTVRVYASAVTDVGPVLSEATRITVFAGPPYYIAVGSEQCNLQGWATVNVTNGVTAIVSDVYYNPVQDSITVYFTVDECVIEAYDITKNNSGVASVEFRTGAPYVDGIVWVIAETEGGLVKDSSYFINSHIAASLVLTIGRQSFLANGKDKSFFWADVRDLNNNFVVNGTVVETATIFGSATEGTTKDGCNASIYEGEYKAPTLEQDYSVTGANDDGIGAIDVLTARAGFTGSSIVCTLLTANAFSATSSITVGAVVIPYSSTGTPLHAIVRDRYNNPLADHTMVATITAGTINAATTPQETNTFGEAFGFLIDAPAAPAPDIDGNIADTRAIVTITDNDARGGPPLSIEVTFSASK